MDSKLSSATVSVADEATSEEDVVMDTEAEAEATSEAMDTVDADVVVEELLVEAVAQTNPHRLEKSHLRSGVL